MFAMKPYEERVPDIQYRDLLRLVLETGEKVETQQGVPARTIIGPSPLRYQFENGFPMITERNLAPVIFPVTIWQQAIGEIWAFVNGAMTLEGLESFGCYWWRDFATEKKCAKRGLPVGDLGPGSYGGAFAHFPTKDGGEMNQWEVIIDQARDFPHLRTLLVTDWIPNYIPRGPKYEQKVVVAPCHGIIVHLRIINGQLTVTMVQRSADLVVGVPNNIVQYAALALAIGQVLEVKVKEFVHFMIDAHLYEDQLEAAVTMTHRAPQPFPTMTVNPNKDNLFTFRREDFVLSDYHPHPGIKNIPVAI